MSNQDWKFHVSCCECDDDYVSRPCGDARGYAQEAYERGKREGIAEGIRIERARVVVWLLKSHEEHCISEQDAGNLATDIERGEHVAEGDRKNG